MKKTIAAIFFILATSYINISYANGDIKDIKDVNFKIKSVSMLSVAKSSNNDEIAYKIKSFDKNMYLLKYTQPKSQVSKNKILPISIFDSAGNITTKKINSIGYCEKTNKLDHFCELRFSLKKGLASLLVNHSKGVKTKFDMTNLMASLNYEDNKLILTNSSSEKIEITKITGDVVESPCADSRITLEKDDKIELPIKFIGFSEDTDNSVRIEYVFNGTVSIIVIDFFVTSNECAGQCAMTDLMAASRYGLYLNAKELLNKEGIDVNKSNCCGHTAFRHAVMHNHLDIAKLLIEKGVDMDVDGNFMAFIEACSKGYYEIVKLCLKKGISDIDRVDDDGRTALIHAALNGRCKVMKLLINKGADVNKFDSNGDTPLMHAVEQGYLCAVELLIQNGAHLDHKNNYGSTALMFASLVSKNCEIMKLLIDNGAGIDIGNNDGNTPIIYAVDTDNLCAVRALIERQRYINDIDEAYDIVNKKNKMNLTALDMAIKNKSEDIAVLLKEASKNEYASENEYEWLL